VRVVGLTGGIGSGKSTVAAALVRRGLPVVDADVLARDCVAPGTSGLAAVVSRFGPTVLAADGSLDRRALATVVFADADARRDLEAITHPCIRAGIARAIDALRTAPRPPAAVVVEHPLLVEGGRPDWVDVVVVVEAPLEDRIARVVATRDIGAEEVRARIAVQADDATRRAVADHVLVNGGNLAELEQTLDELVAQLGLAT
jgi:dephospho-CoA kinase